MNDEANRRGTWPAVKRAPSRLSDVLFVAGCFVAALLFAGLLVWLMNRE